MIFTNFAQKRLPSMRAHDQRMKTALMNALKKGMAIPDILSLEVFAEQMVVTNTRWPGKFVVGNMYGMPDIWKAFQDDNVREIAVMSGTQIGKTALLWLYALWSIYYFKATVLVVSATSQNQDKAVADYKSHLTHFPQIEKIRLDNLKHSTVSKRFDIHFTNGGRLIFQNIGQKDAMKGHTCDIVLFDEVDSYQDKHRKLLREASSRVKANYNKSKIAFFSAPARTEETSLILSEVQNRLWSHWHLLCPKCKVLQRPSIDGILGSTCEELGKTIADFKEPAYYVCEQCDHKIKQDAWEDAWRLGGWHSSKAEQITNKKISFWLSAMGVESINGLHSKKVEAIQQVYTEGLQDKILSLHSDVLGYPAQSTTSHIDYHRARIKLVRNYTHKDLPDEFLLASAGVDCQGDRLVLCVMGFGLVPRTSQLTAYGLLYKDFKHLPQGADVVDMVTEGSAWLRLYNYINDAGFNTKTPFEKDYGIEACFIDSGYKPTSALTIARTMREQKITDAYHIKGSATGTLAYEMFRPESLPYKTPSLYAKYPVPVGVNVLKSWIAMNIATSLASLDTATFTVSSLEKNGCNTERFWNELGAEASQSKTSIEGKTFTAWSNPMDKPNEALDCVGYAYGAVEFLARRRGYESVSAYLIDLRKKRDAYLIAKSAEKQKEEK